MDDLNTLMGIPPMQGKAVPEVKGILLVLNIVILALLERRVA